MWLGLGNNKFADGTWHHFLFPIKPSVKLIPILKPKILYIVAGFSLFFEFIYYHYKIIEIYPYFHMYGYIGVFILLKGLRMSL